MNAIIVSLLFVPLICSFLIFMIPNSRKEIFRPIGIIFSLITLTQCFYLLFSDYGKTKFVRVFHYGGWYEILKNGNHYLLLGNEDWMSKEEEVIKTMKKELYDWASEELTNFGE